MKTYEAPAAVQSGSVVRNTLGKLSGTEFAGVGQIPSAGAVGFNL